MTEEIKQKAMSNTVVELNWLKKVKAILMTLGVVNKNTMLDFDSWKTLYDEGLTPIKAVKADLEDYQLPFISYQKVCENLKEL